MMHKNQRMPLVVGAWASLLMVAYPPWSAVVPVYPGPQGALVSAAIATDYSWIWAPPWYSGLSVGSKLDLIRLGAQLAALWLVVLVHVWIWAPGRAASVDGAEKDVGGETLGKPSG